jgi:hypothetical protein
VCLCLTIFAYNNLVQQYVSVRKTIVSEDILSKDFVCNLSACHGACCVDGDAGAPLSLKKLKFRRNLS